MRLKNRPKLSKQHMWFLEHTKVLLALSPAKLTNGEGTTLTEF